MPSGQKEMLINTQERAISTDINRLQKFLGKQIADAYRYLFAYLATDEGGSGAAPAVASSTAGWMVLNGLWARPEIGTVNLFIEPGVVAMVDPDSPNSSDDSVLKLIASPGVSNAGDLTLTAGGGGTRIDVIEFQRINSIDESSSRDIYNPATGQFTAQLVTKVRSDKLSWRIRLGTPGAGFPGTAAGWFPVAVASVPNAATTWNDCIVWDVRPLVQDLVDGTPVTQNFPKIGKSYGTFMDNGSAVTCAGVFESQLNQWRAGGEIAASNSGVAGGQLEVDGNDVQEPGLTPVDNLPVYLYAAMPFSLPRWARYTASSSGVRIPLPMRGIPIFTDQATLFTGKPTAAIALPTALGLGSNTTNAVMIASTGWKSGALMNAGIADGWTILADFMTSVSPASGAGTATVVYELSDNDHHPRGATAVRLRFSTTVEAAVGDKGFVFQRTVSLLDATTNVVAQYISIETKDSLTPLAQGDVIEVDVPLHALTNMPTGSDVTRRFRVEYSAGITAGAITYTLQSCRVMGWKIGM